MSVSINSEAHNETRDRDAGVRAGASLDENNEIVGLKMTDGKVLYSRRSSMARASSQFFTTEPVEKDSGGTCIYFVGGDSELFQRHILPYVLSNDAMIPPGNTDLLLRRLRAEAVAFGMNDLVATLDNNRSRNDDIIGLEFSNGGVCYCPRSTLTKAPYFAGRFRGSFSEAVSYYDDQGRPVYFIHRNGDLFHNYIIEYLRTNHPGQLPPFSQDPELWRALRKEALYYEIRGILYWKETKKGQSDEYRNPNETGAVHVGGWVDNITNEQIQALRDGNVSLPVLAHSTGSRNALVPFALLFPATIYLAPTAFIVSLFFLTSRLSVRLTHYSLRSDRCGMSHWNLEGSENGKEWVVLHEARNDPHLKKPTDRRMDATKEAVMGDVESRESSEKQAAEALVVSYAEKEFRHTWTIDPSPTAFYHYFRIIGIGERHGGNKCLHGVGLELFGDVHEW